MLSFIHTLTQLNSYHNSIKFLKMEIKNTHGDDLHFLFFPFMAQGHLIPCIDMAKLFASRGHRSTITTTSYFSDSLSKTLSRIGDLAARINVDTIRIPCSDVGLPEGMESLHMTKTVGEQMSFFKATGLLGPQLDELLRRHRPDCLVADTFFPWATAVAEVLGMPRLVFHGSSYFALCATLSVFLHRPHEKAASDSELFAIPQLPDEILFTRDKIPDFVKEEEQDNPVGEFAKMYKSMLEADLASYGVVVNSFYELEPAYAKCYTEVLGVNKAWHIGPLFLYGRENMEASSDEHECLKWLDSKEPNSVVYVCFGSLVNFSDAQLVEIAAGLEASEKEFVWVVNKEKREGSESGFSEEWLPEGFEERVVGKGKGLIIRGWAPQVMILEHKAVGGFVTHCGWNSTLEAVCAGVPMATWPVFAEQFYNEKMVSQVLGFRVEIGVRKWSRHSEDLVRREVVESVVKRIMEGEEAEEMRSKAKRLAGMARRAIKEGGSSYSDLNNLFYHFRSRADSLNSD